MNLKINITKFYLKIFFFTRCQHFCGHDHKRRINYLVTWYIKPHEDNFYFTKIKKFSFYDKYFNSILEDSNKGWKRCSTLINPSMGLEKSMSVLSTTSERKRKYF